MVMPQSENLLLHLKTQFGNDLFDPTLARIQEIEKATEKLRQCLLPPDFTSSATPDAVETREFLIDTIERNLLLVPAEKYGILLQFLNDLKTPPVDVNADPLDKVVAVTSQLEACLREIIYPEKGS